RFGIARHTLYLRIGPNGKRAALRAKKLEAMEAQAPGPASGDEIAAMVARELRELGEKIIEASGVRSTARVRTDGRIAVRVHHSEEIWAQARRDYEEGHHTAGVIAERYGMNEDTIRYRAWKEGWDKRRTEAPAPLLPFPDPAQLDEAGKSAWAKIAHEA